MRRYRVKAGVKLLMVFRYPHVTEDRDMGLSGSTYDRPMSAQRALREVYSLIIGGD